MATKWTRKKVNADSLNNGNEWTKDDQVAIEELNSMVNTGLYAQDFAEKLVTNIDTSEVNNIGIPSVSLIDGDGATTDKPYKKFKFSNLKGEKGDPGVGATVVQTTGTSTDDVMSQKAVTDSFSNSVHITEQTLTNEQKTQARTNIGASSSADLFVWAQRKMQEEDLNTLADAGYQKAYISRYTPSTANTPVANTYGNVISLRNSGSELTQLAMGAQHPTKLFYRGASGLGSYGTWKEVDTIAQKGGNYIAYTSGLKIQWGEANIPSQIGVGTVITPTIKLPIAMTTGTYKIMGICTNSNVNFGYDNRQASSFTLGIRNLGSAAITTNSSYSWVVIGY